MTELATAPPDPAPPWLGSGPPDDLDEDLLDPHEEIGVGSAAAVR